MNKFTSSVRKWDKKRVFSACPNVTHCKCCLSLCMLSILQPYVGLLIAGISEASKLLTVSLCNHKFLSSGFTLLLFPPQFLVVLWLQELWLRSSIFILGWIKVSLKYKLISKEKKSPPGLPFCSFHRDPSVGHQVHFHLYSHCHPERYH